MYPEPAEAHRFAGPRVIPRKVCVHAGWDGGVTIGRGRPQRILLLCFAHSASSQPWVVLCLTSLAMASSLRESERRSSVQKGLRLAVDKRLRNGR